MTAIKKGDRVKVRMMGNYYYGVVIAKKLCNGVMMYSVRTDFGNVVTDLYVTQLSHSVREWDDE